MAINKLAGFNIGAPEAVDTRLVLTTLEMKNMPDYKMPGTYFAVNSDNQKLYVYNSANSANDTYGKFREYNAWSTVVYDSKTISGDGSSDNPYGVNFQYGWTTDNKISAFGPAGNMSAIAAGNTYSASDAWISIDNDNSTIGLSQSAQNVWVNLTSAYDAWKSVPVPPSAQNHKYYGYSDNAWKELPIYEMSDTVYSSVNEDKIQLHSKVNLSLDDGLLKFENGFFNQ